jgi:hypothetical protein
MTPHANYAERRRGLVKSEPRVFGVAEGKIPTLFVRSTVFSALIAKHTYILLFTSVFSGFGFQESFCITYLHNTHHSIARSVNLSRLARHRCYEVIAFKGSGSL